MEKKQEKKPPSEAQLAARAASGKRLGAMHEEKRQEKKAATALREKPENEPNADHLAPIHQHLYGKVPQPESHPSDRETSRQARSPDRAGFGRRKRVPLGVPVQRLQANVPSGMTGRWTNDTPGRIQRALEGGYQFISSNGEVVQDRNGCRSEIVGTGRDGGAMKAFLMAIPTVLYEEDQAAKAALNKERMSAIKRGEPTQVAEQDKSAFYTPSEGINLRDEVR